MDKINLERQLLACFTPNGIRKCLVKLAALNPQKFLWELFQSWSIPSPLHSMLMSLQQGFLQDFAFILIGKSRELRAKKDYISAIAMLNVLRAELRRPEIIANNPAVGKLTKLVSWEGLLYQIDQAFEEWPIKSGDNSELITKCKLCLATVNSSDNFVPRPKILESCAAMLLNLNEWSSVVPLEAIKNRFPPIDLITAFASVGLDKEKFKGVSKKCRDCCELVLPLFINAPPKVEKSKSRNVSRESPTPMITLSINPFLKKLRDPYVVSVVMSLLAKLHNILKDESNFDINADYMFFWPTSISK